MREDEKRCEEREREEEKKKERRQGRVEDKRKKEGAKKNEGCGRARPVIGWAGGWAGVFLGLVSHRIRTLDGIAFTPYIRSTQKRVMLIRTESLNPSRPPDPCGSSSRLRIVCGTLRSGVMA